MRHEAWLASPTPGPEEIRGTQRDFWLQVKRSALSKAAVMPQHAEKLARAERMLTGPECPEQLEYLRTWIHQLHGRSGVGMNGAAPLTYDTLNAWARFNGVELTGDEVHTLFFLDFLLSNPDTPIGEDDDDRPKFSRPRPSSSVGEIPERPARPRSPSRG